jgi:hypothetical protein
MPSLIMEICPVDGGGPVLVPMLIDISPASMLAMSGWLGYTAALIDTRIER